LSFNIYFIFDRKHGKVAQFFVFVLSKCHSNRMM